MCVKATQTIPHRRGANSQQHGALQHPISADAYSITSHFDVSQVWPFIDNENVKNFHCESSDM